MAIKCQIFIKTHKNRPPATRECTSLFSTPLTGDIFRQKKLPFGLKSPLFSKTPVARLHLELSGRVDSASATKMVDSNSIPGPVKPETTKTGIHSNPSLKFSKKRGQCEASTLCGR